MILRKNTINLFDVNHAQRAVFLATVLQRRSTILTDTKMTTWSDNVRAPVFHTDYAFVLLLQLSRTVIPKIEMIESGSRINTRK